MPAIDYSHMTPAEKLDLIGEIWDSIEAGDIPLTAEQAAELDRRLATLDEDIELGMTAAESLALLEQRYG
jgi:putative addiction module component (TIGR02574 family)